MAGEGVAVPSGARGGGGVCLRLGPFVSCESPERVGLALYESAHLRLSDSARPGSEAPLCLTTKGRPWGRPHQGVGCGGCQ